MIKLYGNPYSRANRVKWALEESGAPYEEEVVALGKEGTRTASFLKINPNGHVPVIDDGGWVLFESVPICLYIAKRYSPDKLYVQTIEHEARLLQWSVWAMTELEKNIETASLHTTWLPSAARSADKAESARGEVARCTEMIAQGIRNSGYLVSNRFSVADLIVTEVLTNIVHSGYDLARSAETAAYVKRNLSRPAAKAAFAGDILQPFL